MTTSDTDTATASEVPAQGAEPQTNTPAEFGAWLKSEIVQWGKVIADAQIKVE